MAVKSIDLVSEDTSRLDAFHEAGYDWEPQGVTYPVRRVYKLTNDDGSEQFVAVELNYDSYGQGISSVTHPKLVAPKEKTVLVYE